MKELQLSFRFADFQYVTCLCTVWQCILLFVLKKFALVPAVRLRTINHWRLTLCFQQPKVPQTDT